MLASLVNFRTFNELWVWAVWWTALKAHQRKAQKRYGTFIMRRIFILIIIAFFATDTFSQADSILIETKFPKNPFKTQLKYFISKKDSLINGTFIEYSSWGNVIVHGQYIKGDKFGIWYYYADNEKHQIVESLDFTNFKIILVDTTKLNTLSYPHYFGTQQDMYIFINSNIRKVLTKDDYTKFNGKQILIGFNIDVNGYATDVKVLRNGIKNKIIEDKLIAVFKSMPKWVVSPRRHELGFQIPIRIKEK